MTWYIRKSIKVGPFRINLSKSGLGVSGGITGARVGVDARGRSYYHTGRGGLYARGRASAQFVFWVFVVLAIFMLLRIFW